MVMELTKENIRNSDALWQWVKKECEKDNIEKVTVETLLDEMPIDNGAGFTMKYIKNRILTITLGSNQ